VNVVDTLPATAPDALRFVAGHPGSTLSDVLDGLPGRSTSLVRSAVEALRRSGLVERDSKGGLVATRKGVEEARGDLDEALDDLEADEEPTDPPRRVVEAPTGDGYHSPINLGEDLDDDLDDETEDEGPPKVVEAFEDPIPTLEEVEAEVEAPEPERIRRTRDASLAEQDALVLEALRSRPGGLAREVVEALRSDVKVDVHRTLLRLKARGEAAVSRATAGARWYAVETLAPPTVDPGVEVEARIAELRAELRGLDVRRVEVVASIAALERASGRRG